MGLKQFQLVRISAFLCILRIVISQGCQVDGSLERSQIQVMQQLELSSHPGESNSASCCQVAEPSHSDLCFKL